MKVVYHSLLTRNHQVVVKNSEPLLVVEPATGKLMQGGYSEEIRAQFDNYIFSTEDERIIKYMDVPKNGLGTHWIRLQEAKPASK